MAGFESTLITAIAASIVSVLVFLGITIALALYWTSIARRIAPNRFAEPRVLPSHLHRGHPKYPMNPFFQEQS
ncbi:hypothetical protein EV127DRAFT_477055 [Xylaria flabelliformis]|nr:hypothetical protein EV127DRAFT_477055 [Xylaria flabelliformis]